MGLLNEDSCCGVAEVHIQRSLHMKNITVSPSGGDNEGIINRLLTLWLNINKVLCPLATPSHHHRGQDLIRSQYLNTVVSTVHPPLSTVVLAMCTAGLVSTDWDAGEG